jgi:hypothetical protein
MVRKAIRNRVQAYLAGLGHLTYLIRSSKINAWPAVKLADRFRSESLIHAIPRFVVNVDGTEQRIGKAELQRAVIAERRFFLGSYPRFLGLKNPNHRKSILTDWQRVLFAAVLSPVDRITVDSTDLSHIAQAIEIVPDGGKASPRVEQLLRYGSRQHGLFVTGAAYSKKDWQVFINRLRISRRAMPRIYGRYAAVWSYWYEADMRNGLDALPKLIVQADHLREDFCKLPYRSGIVGDRMREPIDIQLRVLRNDLARQLEQIHEAVRSARQGRAPRPPKFYEPLRPFTKRPTTHPPRRRLTPVNKLVFEPVELKTRRDARNVPIEKLPFQNLRACDRNLDVLWSPRELAFLERNTVRRIMRDPGLTFTDVQWDGANIWVGTLEKGIIVITPHGTVHRRIDHSDGLPPSDRGLLLYPLREGWVCAVGSFGEHERGWCAIVTTAGAKPTAPNATVNVFHQAKEVTNAVGLGRLGGNAKLVFRPTWLHAYDGGGGPGYLLVGRANSYGTARYPLMIELKTFKAWVHFRDFGAAERLRSDAFFSRDGELLVASSRDICQWGGFTMNAPTVIAPQSRQFAGCLLEHNGWIYAPGTIWYRLKPDGTAIEVLANNLPSKYIFDYYAVSSNHGLIGWSKDGAIHRIRPRRTSR